jgi:hypothetical protein
MATTSAMPVPAAAPSTAEVTILCTSRWNSVTNNFCAEDEISRPQTQATDLVSEPLCFPLFRIPDDGQSPETQHFSEWYTPSSESYRFQHSIVSVLKLKLIYDRQSVGKSLLVSGAHLETTTNFSFSLKFFQTVADLLFCSALSDERTGL